MHFEWKIGGLKVDGIFKVFVFVCFLNLGVTYFEALEVEKVVGFAHFFSLSGDAFWIVLFSCVGPTRQRNIGKVPQL